ncbi:uncharacterized protein RCO7_06244 [Rhynchosporium graminicola]|uniref:3'-5' exonuclease domain-containing protein n=1 Tax=Rhynchosporium graminicola TaxID=2792576 RepID=A0A1E1KWI0_9HELO|nr:uncharacterized protein RCO7_06244 [Rhynchosporium commune]
MNAIEGNTAASDNMRSAAAKMGGRALSIPTRANTTPASYRKWSPNHGIVFSGPWNPNQGIVFRPSAGTPRAMSTSDVNSMRQEHLFHSEVEDNYVMASADTAALERQPTITPQATVAANLKKVGEQDPKNSKVSKISLKTHTPETNVPKKTAPETAPSKTPEGIEPEDPLQNEVPETTTILKMDEALFRKAKNAKHGSPESYWSHNLYRGPLRADGKEHKTIVHYCKSILTTERVLATYFSDSKVIGFDIEWKEGAHRNSTPKQNVSLIQIANEERIALFHVALYPHHELVAPGFKKLMEDSSVTKVGVSIKADCTRLRKTMGIDSKGIFELSHLYKLVKHSTDKTHSEINRRLVSLANQTKEHLHLPMFKGDVRTSDWSKILNLDQIMYAASDSYAGLQIYHTLEMKRKQLDPTPPRPYHAELNLPIRIAEGVEIPSDVEAEEVEPEEPAITSPNLNPTTKNITKKLSKKELKAATENISLEDPELEYALTGRYPQARRTSLIRKIVHGPSSNETDTSPTYERKLPSLFSSYTSPLVHAAETLASTHLDSIQNRYPRRPNPHHPLPPHTTELLQRGKNLRTYFLWYENPELSLDDVGKMLRSPPLTGRAVAVSILEAIRREKVPFDKRRLREVLGKWRGMGNKWVVGTRYGALEKECGFVFGEGDEGDEVQKPGEVVEDISSTQSEGDSVGEKI